MNRRMYAVVAALSAAVLCLSSYEIAEANSPRPDTVSATQGLGACATAAGYLRLVNGSAKCASGYTNVSLAQQSTVAHTRAISVTTGSTSRTIALPSHNSIEVVCTVGSDQTEGNLYVANTDSTAVQVRGTLQTQTRSGSSYYYYDGGGDTTFIDNSPQLVDLSKTGYFHSVVPSGYGYNAHLQATVIAAGATYAVSADWQMLGSASCQMDVTVQLTG